MSEEVDAAFLTRARGDLLAYLERNGVKHAGVPEVPAWVLAPYVAVWMVQSGHHPGSTGWFAISGDVPTDYVSSHDAPDARAAVRHFARLWREIAAYMDRGEEHPECRIGKSESWPTLHGQLNSRAELLGEFAEDDRLWMEDPA